MVVVVMVVVRVKAYGKYYVVLMAQAAQLHGQRDRGGMQTSTVQGMTQRKQCR